MLKKIKKIKNLYYQYVKSWLYKTFPCLQIDLLNSKTINLSDVTYEDVQLCVDILKQDLKKINPHRLSNSFDTYNHSLSEIEDILKYVFTCINKDIRMFNHNSFYNNKFNIGLDVFLYTNTIERGFNVKERLIKVGEDLLEIKKVNSIYINGVLQKCIFSYINIIKNI